MPPELIHPGRNDLPGVQPSVNIGYLRKLTRLARGLKPYLFDFKISENDVPTERCIN